MGSDDFFVFFAGIIVGLISSVIFGLISGIYGDWSFFEGVVKNETS